MFGGQSAIDTHGVEHAFRASSGLRDYPNGIQIIQPGVARNELPCGAEIKNSSTLKGVESMPHVGYGPEFL